MVVKGEVGALFPLLALMEWVCGSLLTVASLLLFVTSSLRLRLGFLLDSGRTFGVGTSFCDWGIQNICRNKEAYVADLPGSMCTDMGTGTGMDTVWWNCNFWKIRTRVWQVGVRQAGIRILNLYIYKILKLTNFFL